MAIRKLAICLALVFATGVALTESTVTTTKHFDNYIAVIDKLTIIADRLRVFEAVWGEIRAEGAANLTQVKVFYDTLQTRITNAKPEEFEEAAELAAIVRQLLIADNGRLLAETLNNDKSSFIAQVTQFRRDLFNNYDVELLNAIFENAIDSVYPNLSPEVLFENLNTIDGGTNAQRSYKVKVNWTLYLYRKFLGRGDVSDAFVYAAAQSIHNFMRNTQYGSLTKDTARRIDIAFSTFTPSLRHLFNTTTICLSNENYMNYYLYFSSAAAGTSSIVQAVLRNGLFEHSTWINSYAYQTIPVTGNFYLSAGLGIWYLYRRTSDWDIVVQRNENYPYDKYWNPSLMEDKIMFEYNEYYMCATSNYNNNLMGFNTKAVRITSKDDPNCRWTISDCTELKS